jgi:hypothetical protein
MTRGTWLSPLPLPDARHVTTLCRLDASRFLCAGQRSDGSGFALVYHPLDAALEPLAAPALRAFVAGASVAERGLGLLAGSGGVTLRVDGHSVRSSIVPGTPDLAAAAIDILGNEWLGTLGALFRKNPWLGQDFRPVFHDGNLGAPFVSILADAGYVVAMTADGAIIEGRAT